MKPLSNRYLAAMLLTLTARSAVAERLIDPTRPSNARVAVATVAEPVRLEAILHSAERRLAIVNGKIVRAGDRVGDARIEEILPNGIRYTLAGTSRTARLEEQALDVRRNVTHEKTQGEDHE